MDVVIVLMGSVKKVTISWSGGKDSAFALYKILASGEYEVANLHTIINSENKRVGLHGVHESLIEMQARSIGIPLVKLYLKNSDNNESFEALTRSFYARCVREDINSVVFGDIFLEDLKSYRESLIKEAGLQSIFPLWQINSLNLVEDFINTGFQTLICSADTAHFGKKHLGLSIDHSLIASLPASVDPCGERGEYHTFVVDGPIFKKPIHVSKGEVVLRWYDYQKKNADSSIEKRRASYWFQELFARTD
jgi:uncharacterized protein (TIGR00290 family)